MARRSGDRHASDDTFLRTLVMQDRWTLFIAAALVAGVLIDPFVSVAATPEFATDVRPILSDHCFACHGPDEKDREADLRLDTKDGLAAVVSAGDVDASELIRRLLSDDPYEQMPPPEYHKPLSKKQKSILKQWVAGGAEFQQHWAFVSPEGNKTLDSKSVDALIEKKLAAIGLQPNGQADRRSLLRRVCLDLTGLPPSHGQIETFLADESPGAYESLVDRLLQSPRYGEHMARFWLDLVRYGDTHGMHLDNYREMWLYRDWVIDAFNRNMPMDQFITQQLAGDLLPDATREQLIASGFNRLNVTTNEGGSIYDEVFARNVMDRTDAFGTIFLGLTTGCAVCHDHKFDPISQRDYYSLSAFFNSLDGRAMDGNNKAPAPTIPVPSESQTEQLAAYTQSLADVRQEMRGPIPSVDAAQKAWQRSIARDDEPMNETLQPIAVTSAQGVALSVSDDGVVQLDGPAADKDTVTILCEVPLSPSAQWQTIQLDALADDGERVGASANGNVVLSEITIETAEPSGDQTDWIPLPIKHAVASHEQADGPFAISYAYDKKVDADKGWAVAGHQDPGPRTAWLIVPDLMATQAGTQLRVRLKYQSRYAKHQFQRVRLSLSDAPPSLPNEKTIRMGPVHTVGPMPIDGTSAGYAARFGAKNTTFDAEEEVKRGKDVFRWRLRDDLAAVEVNEIESIHDRSSVTVIHQDLHAPSQQNVQLLLGADDGHMVFLNGKQIARVEGRRKLSPLSRQYDLPLKKGENHLFIKLINHAGKNELTFAFRSPAVSVPPSLVGLLQRPDADRSKQERDSIRRYYREVRCQHPDWLAMKDLESGFIKAKEKLQESVPTTLVWKELDQPREAYILTRGQYDQPGEAVQRGTPGFLPPMQDELSRDRLGLANWLTSDDHPLTARVAVNRFWQQFFGTGLVRTSEDFGSQGEPPSHPELLDALAVGFRGSGWDVKTLMKTLVMTEAYRRDQHVTDEMIRIDPENRLLARGPRHRLDAEVLRDQALSVSGLLVNRLGGESVKPPQPDGLWYAVGYTNSNTAKFTADQGEKVYRRSVYIFWKRTSAPPQMSTFDAPSRESCTARRERTNTPLQALLLMNETQYLQAAKHLAVRAVKQTDLPNDRQRLHWMFETVTIRPPSVAETTELEKLLADLKIDYRDKPEAAVQIAGDEDPALAPWVVLASTLLNLDEVVSK